MSSHLESYLRSVASSLGAASCSASDIRAALPSFSCVNFTKLTVAAFCWSYGFMIFDGKKCWGKDTTFQNTPGENKCTLDSVFLSGFLASVGLCLSVMTVDTILDWSKWVQHSNTSKSTLAILLLTVFISDALWSYWNYLSFAIASSKDDSYTLGGYFAASLLGFFLNATFFYSVHNGVTFIVEKRVIHSRDATGNGSGAESEKATTEEGQFWYCDVLFAGIVWGAYYGFGPFGLGLSIQVDAESELGIASCNALGTLLGSLLFFAILYGPIIVYNEYWPLILETEPQYPENQERYKTGDRADKEQELEIVHNLMSLSRERSEV